VTLAVTGFTISDRVLRRQTMPVFEWHRLALTGCRLDIGWLSGRGKPAIFCVFSVFSEALMGNWYDACLDRENYFRTGCLASADADVSKALTAVDRKSMGHTVVERSCRHADYRCDFSIYRGGYGKVL
jgi:hypothetical protein